MGGKSKIGKLLDGLTKVYIRFVRQVGIQQIFDLKAIV